MEPLPRLRAAQAMCIVALAPRDSGVVCGWLPLSPSTPPRGLTPVPRAGQINFHSGPHRPGSSAASRGVGGWDDTKLHHVRGRRHRAAIARPAVTCALRASYPS
eukprot:4359853-Pleurochrysis_carterae.AAC.2